MKIRNLSVLNYASGFTLWLYAVEDWAEIFQPGYFNTAADLFRDGDVIYIRAKSGTAQRVVRTDGNNVTLESLR